MKKILAFLLLIFFAGQAQAQNYAATQGSGLTFGTKLVSAVNYPQIVFCDPTTPSQCVGVNSSGQMTVLQSASAAGGSNLAAASVPNNTTAVVVKSSAATLYGVQLYGIGSAPAYLKLYNATSATCGSGTPVMRLMIPAAATAANGNTNNVTFSSIGVAFGTGLTYCVTTGILDTDTTAPAASTFLVNLEYQ